MQYLKDQNEELMRSNSELALKFSSAESSYRLVEVERAGFHAKILELTNKLHERAA
jgi:hypothetical protein